MSRSAEAFYFSDKTSSPAGTSDSSEVARGTGKVRECGGGYPALCKVDRGWFARCVPRAAACDLVLAASSRLGLR
ncbi:hypothetical protein NDU88_003790 [Pleurodeles waltl]|uniref:Uncharacterized protein n=1 Tax=Pleurodeles waltl TaxID=8319 RepID=A0AAV7WQ27_PLEWA|nr:hypothetical protein NDU88_003790 [Pleurodeles waltl]